MRNLILLLWFRVFKKVRVGLVFRMLMEYVFYKKVCEVVENFVIEKFEDGECKEIVM